VNYDDYHDPLGELEDDDGPFFCPHGVEVETSGGACYWCAQEDARDDDYDW
jgi:hypothetical protein